MAILNQNGTNNVGNRPGVAAPEGARRAAFFRRGARMRDARGGAVRAQLHTSAWLVEVDAFDEPDPLEDFNDEFGDPTVVVVSEPTVCPIAWPRPALDISSPVSSPSAGPPCRGVFRPPRRTSAP